MVELLQRGFDENVVCIVLDHLPLSLPLASNNEFYPQFPFLCGIDSSQWRRFLKPLIEKFNYRWKVNSSPLRVFPYYYQVKTVSNEYLGKMGGGPAIDHTFHSRISNWSPRILALLMHYIGWSSEQNSICRSHSVLAGIVSSYSVLPLDAGHFHLSLSDRLGLFGLLFHWIYNWMFCNSLGCYIRYINISLCNGPPYSISPFVFN